MVDVSLAVATILLAFAICKRLWLWLQGKRLVSEAEALLQDVNN